jgi:hypothetical protein
MVKRLTVDALIYHSTNYDGKKGAMVFGRVHVGHVKVGHLLLWSRLYVIWLFGRVKFDRIPVIF